MRKPEFCLCENKGADQLCSDFVFATQIVQFLLYLYLKFQASSLLLWLYRPVCVRTDRRPEDRFSHVTAHITICYFYPRCQTPQEQR